MARIAAIFFLLARMVSGQAGPVNVKPANIDLSEGDPGGAPVGSDAKFISIRARFYPDGPAWLSEPSLGAIDEQGSHAEDEAVRALIVAFANARNAHDGNALSQLYSEDGEWFDPGRQHVVRGRTALAALWGSLPGQVRRTIQSISFPGSELAVVSVATGYAEPAGLHSETFILVKEAGTWRIRVHQSLN